MNILGIIPARGGSKGIPLKNIQKLVGKPLIQYTIDSAKESKINKLVVSTDHPKIAEVSRSLGAEVPFIRSKNLAQDHTSTFQVIKDVIDFLRHEQKYVPDIIVILQPTSPLRDTKLINKSLVLLQRSNASSVISVSRIKQHPYSSFTYSGKYLKPFRKDFFKFDRRQKYPDLYFPTGAIYCFWNKTMEKYGSLYGPKIKPILTTIEDSIDVDTIFDLFVSEMTMLHWDKFKTKFSPNTLKHLK